MIKTVQGVNAMDGSNNSRLSSCSPTLGGITMREFCRSFFWFMIGFIMVMIIHVMTL